MFKKKSVKKEKFFEQTNTHTHTHTQTHRQTTVTSPTHSAARLITQSKSLTDIEMPAINKCLNSSSFNDEHNHFNQIPFFIRTVTDV